MNPKTQVYLSVDLGAGSGRVIAGIYENYALRIEEISRFSSEAVEKDGEIFWNVETIYKNVVAGLNIALEKYSGLVVSAGIDTWGVDYALIDDCGKLVGMPHAYRDPRTNGMIEEAAKIVAPETLYARTGIQPVFFNTLYQLLAEKRYHPENLERARHLLFMPDLMNYLLTGKLGNERTIAGTSQLFDPANSAWADDMIEKFGFPRGIFGDIVAPGSAIGQTIIGGKPLKIVSVCSHDTESATIAISFGEESNAFISSGTWSLIGIESEGPILTETARLNAYSNEASFGDKTAFLCNLTGLWIVQECKKYWDEHECEVFYDKLVEEARNAPAATSFIEPDDPRFVAPGRMPERIEQYFEQTHQAIPETRGELMRSILESMARNYRKAVKNLENISGRKIETMHIVGGGCKNSLLNQLTADALKIPVIAGPVEATAIGNILMQMIASGAILSVEEGREVVRSSFDIQMFSPSNVNNAS